MAEKMQKKEERKKMPKNYPKILTELASSFWAIRPESLQGILHLVQTGFQSVRDGDRELFHQADEPAKKALVAHLGNPLSENSDVFIKGTTGIMFLDGPIIPRDALFTRLSGMVSIETLKDNLQTLQSKPEVRNIVLLVDSPGGVTTGVSEFADLVRASDVPVTAFAYGSAASAAYWIAAGAKNFLASKSSIIGSIGTVVTYMDDTKRLEMEGFKEIEIVSSQSPDKRPDPTTSEGKEKIRAVLDQMTEVFINSVAEFRGVTYDKVAEDFGQGGVVIGQVAVDAGMVDGITTLDLLLAELNKPGGDGGAATFFTANNQQTVEGSQMSKTDKNKTQTTEAAETQETPATTVDTTAIAADAVKAERERVQGIEGIMDKFKDQPANVRKAAQTCIDENKYIEGSTVESVQGKVLDAVLKAQAEIPAATAEGARDLAATAEELPAGNETDEEPEAQAAAEEKEVVANLGEGMKQA